MRRRSWHWFNIVLRLEFKLHEITERISQRIQQQYSRDPSLLIKDSLSLDSKACLFWFIYIGGTILLDEARFKNDRRPCGTSATVGIPQNKKNK